MVTLPSAVARFAGSQEKSERLKFSYDKVFPMDTQQESIYSFTGAEIVEGVLEGFNGTIFAYGQTSSGKTFTMMGPSIDDLEMRGIIPRIVSSVFERIEQASEAIEFSVKVSFAEIYLERIKDLLNPKKINLPIHEDKEKGVYIDDLTETYVTEEREVYSVIKLGNDNRAIGVTDMNAQSS